MSHPALTLTEPLDGYFPDPWLALFLAMGGMVAAYTEGWLTGGIGGYLEWQPPRATGGKSESTRHCRVTRSP